MFLGMFIVVVVSFYFFAKMREFKKIQNAKFKVALARAFLGYARVVKLIVGPASMSRKVSLMVTP
jgi:hypothetical protein